MNIPTIIQQRPQCVRVYNFLKAHGKCNVAQIIAGANVLDARSAIRFLRKAGIRVLDEWRTTTEKYNYKVYWLSKDNNDTIATTTRTASLWD